MYAGLLLAYRVKLAVYSFKSSLSDGHAVAWVEYCLLVGGILWMEELDGYRLPTSGHLCTVIN